MRRFVTLTRANLLALLVGGRSQAHQECFEALRSGAPFRVHHGTVTREGALRIYQLRAQATHLVGTETLGVDQALKDLADCGLPQLRVTAVSGDHDFMVFLDPECTQVIACLGVERRLGQ